MVQEAAPMKVDSDEGIELYNALVIEVLSSQELMVPGSKLMRAEKQLLIYYYAAKVHEFREQILSLWRGESDLPKEGLAEPFLSCVRKLKTSWQDQGKSTAVKAKKVFGHPGVIKFCQTMPNFPSSSNGSFVFLQQRPTAAVGGLWCFTEGCGSDPVGDLETKGLALVLRMDSYLKDAVVLVSPCLQNGVISAQSEDLSKMIMREPEVWRRLLKTEHELFSPASASLIKQVLRSGAATVTPKKPRPEVDDETPEKEKMEKPKKAKNEEKAKMEELGQQGYSKLLEATLEELGFFTEPFQGLRWLENKKQLLVYHHAARMNEQKDAILQAIAGGEVENLDPIYQRAARSVGHQLLKLFEGEKMKKIFSHDQVIRFHTLKGLPVHRESCVFLRERPQSSSDILRKTPSIFRDLIRYRGQTSPLMELEQQHLALVLIVADRNPRAFLVISPLLSKPELLEKVSSYSWTEIKEQLQDELASLIRRESDVWRGFIQRHADMVSKESLKIIQKVLKSCVPGSGLGEFTLRFAEDVEEATEARELAEMRFAEAEQRWDMSAQLAVAEVEGKRLESEKKVKKLTSLEQRLKNRARLQALRLKANTSRVLEEERETAEERLETMQKDHRDEKSRLQKDLEEIRSALGREEVRSTQLREEATLLEESKQELLQAIAKLDAEERKDRRHWRTKNAVLKHHLKQSQLQQKELVAKMKTEAEARLAEVQTALSQEAAQLRRELEEAQKAQRSGFAQLEVQTAALQRTGQLNTELRSAAAKAEEDARSAQQAAAAAVASKEETKSQVQNLQQELKVAEELCRSAETKQKEASTLQLEAEQRATEAEKAYLAVEERELRAKAELKSQSQEAHRLTEKCALLSQEKAELEVKVQQKLISQEQAEQSLMAKKAEFQVLQETLKTLQDSNRTLRDERAAACAASEEALQLSTEAQGLVETAKSQRLRAEAEAAESRKQAAMAEEQLKEAAQRLAEFETECQSWSCQVSKLRRSCAVKEAEVAKAKDEERKAAMKFTAQAQEASRLSASCADLKGQLSSWRSAADAAIRRAEQAEAERAVALSASELSEEDVRRLVKEGPMQPMSAPEEPDSLIEDLEKMLQAESSPEKADEPIQVEVTASSSPTHLHVEQAAGAEPAEPAEVLEAPSKKQRLEEGDAGVTSLAAPLRRIRFKSSGGQSGEASSNSRMVK